MKGHPLPMRWLALVVMLAACERQPEVALSLDTIVAGSDSLISCWGQPGYCTDGGETLDTNDDGVPDRWEGPIRWSEWPDSGNVQFGFQEVCELPDGPCMQRLETRERER